VRVAFLDLARALSCALSHFGTHIVKLALIRE